MINLDDILNNDAPQIRVQGFPVPGMDEVEIHELSLAERIEFMDESLEIDSNESDRKFADKWLWRLMAGPEKKGKPVDRKKLRQKLSYDQAQAILALGYNFAIEEAAKK